MRNIEIRNSRTLSVGYLPSIEVLPFMEWARNNSVDCHPYSSYGAMIRGLMQGEIDGGILPWELAVVDLLLRPGQRIRWRVPAVLRACPMELVLSHSAMKKVNRNRTRRLSPGSVKLTFGIEAKHSFSRLQIELWQQNSGHDHLASPDFKMVPMGMMLTGLENGVIDGFLAPLPCGTQAESQGNGKVDRKFGGGPFTQDIVLVCEEGALNYRNGVLNNLAGDLGGGEDFYSDDESLEKAFERMSSETSTKLNPALGIQSCRKYPLDAMPGEFIPDEDWFRKELDVIARRSGIKIRESLSSEISIISTK